jgi:hypothetical protein
MHMAIHAQLYEVGLYIAIFLPWRKINVAFTNDPEIAMGCMHTVYIVACNGPTLGLLYPYGLYIYRVCRVVQYIRGIAMQD